MPKTELLEMRVSRGSGLFEVGVEDAKVRFKRIPEKTEVACYELNYGKYRQIKSTHSGNPYWQPESYQMEPDDKLVGEASVWVVEIAPCKGRIGVFRSREEFLLMMQREFGAEILESVVSET